MTAMMTLKAQSEVHYLREAGSTNVGAKRQEVQDWLVLWIFNHFFSGAEAFVSAHLQDFPKDLKGQAFPRGVGDRKSTRLNSSHSQISYAVFCLKKKKTIDSQQTFYQYERYHCEVFLLKMLTVNSYFLRSKKRDHNPSELSDNILCLDSIMIVLQ